MKANHKKELAVLAKIWVLAIAIIAVGVLIAMARQYIAGRW